MFTLAVKLCTRLGALPVTWMATQEGGMSGPVGLVRLGERYLVDEIRDFN